MESTAANNNKGEEVQQPITANEKYDYQSQ
jgi:hypothetical protein